MSVKISVNGVSEFQVAIDKLDEGLQAKVFECLAAWAASVKEEAMRLVPVKTGYLRSTIYATVQGWVATIGASATYAIFVEMGTRRMAAEPYLWPAVYGALPELESLIVEAIEQAKVEAGF